jgi:ATP-dependent HslUV protease ATP-binding subunit HslU
MTVKESHEILINDESDKLIEQDKIVKLQSYQLKIME